MPDFNVPVFCPNGDVFSFSLIHYEGEPPGIVTLTNNKAGPCPKCGAMGDIPDGTWTGDMIRALAALEREQIRQVRDVVNIANRRGDAAGLQAAEKLADAPQ